MGIEEPKYEKSRNGRNKEKRGGKMQGWQSVVVRGGLCAFL